MDPKKVLILYASAGHGHEKAARALQEAYASRGCTVKMADALELVPSFFGANYKKTYLWLIQKAPWLWGFFYYLTDIPWTTLLTRPSRRLVNTLMARKLERWVLEENPSVVLSTHFLPTEVCGAMKKNGRLQAKLATVITDYLPHRFWISQKSDIYFVAIEETKKALVACGVPPEKIVVTGIPIEAKFEEALKHPKPPAAHHTILVTSGGAAVGAIETITHAILRIQKPIEIFVVCGTNRHLKEKLGAIASKDSRLKTFGFVNNMQELMQASDVVVGKGGGLTMTESFALERPMIIYHPVPGQESRNVRCARSYYAAVQARSLHEIDDDILDMLKHPDHLESFKAGCRKMASVRSAKKIFEYLHGQD